MLRGNDNKLKFIGHFVLEFVSLSRGMPINISLLANLFLSLLVYLTFGSLAMFSFEFVPLSKEHTNKFSFIDILFQSCKSLAIVCVFVGIDKKVGAFWLFFVVVCKDVITSTIVV